MALLTCFSIIVSEDKVGARATESAFSIDPPHGTDVHFFVENILIGSEAFLIVIDEGGGGTGIPAGDSGARIVVVVGAGERGDMGEAGY